jgi:hypothetical protein
MTVSMVVDFSWFPLEFFFPDEVLDGNLQQSRCFFFIIIIFFYSCTGPDQAVAGGRHCVPRRSVVLSTETFEIRIHILSLSLAILKETESHLCARLLISFVKVC